MALVKKWLVNAPNKKVAYISVGGMPGDQAFVHGMSMSNEKLAKQFPRIFVEYEEYEEDPIPKNPKRKILTEPAPVPPTQPRQEEPVLKLEDEILTEPAPVEDLEVARESDEDETKPRGRGRPKGAKNKKQILEG